MKRSTKAIVGAIVTFSLGVSTSASAERPPLDRQPAKGYTSVEMFKAMESGDIEVKLIPKDASEATIVLTNKSKKPLAVGVPEAFVGVPVLPQFGGGRGGGMAGGGMGGMMGGGMGSMGGGMQGMGMGMMGMMGGMMGMMGGMGGMMGGMGMMGMGGMMNIKADTTRKFKVKAVCLEHGKKDPNPRVAYELKPVVELAKKKPDVHEVLKMLGRGEISQNVAQAASWHLMDGLSWSELAAKDRFHSEITGQRQKWFSPQELLLASRVVRVAHVRAEKFKEKISLASKETSQNPVGQD